MTKYLLSDRERNGLDDSDFYAVFWDTETQTIRSEEYGSTRYPSPRTAPMNEYLRDIPEDELEKARVHFQNRLFDIFESLDRSQRDYPQDVGRGDYLAVTEAGTFVDKQRDSEVEYKVGEVGQVIWVGTFRRIYRNGYNKRNRSTLRVGLKFDDGRVIFIGLSKCRLAREYATVDELVDQAIQASKGDRFYVLFNNPGYIQF